MTKSEYNRFCNNFNSKVGGLIFERVSKLQFFLSALANQALLECNIKTDDFVYFDIIDDDPQFPEFEMEIQVDGQLVRTKISINKEF